MPKHRASIATHPRGQRRPTAGRSILSGSRVALVAEVREGMAAEGLAGEGLVAVPLAGGIIPPRDAATLKAAGVAAVTTPKDYDLTAILADIVEIVDRGTREAA